MQVKLIDHMGSDLTVVNAARVSFAKVSEWDEIPFGDGPTKGLLNEGDEKLIKYLAKHNHWSPLDIAVCSFILRLQSLLQDNLLNTKSAWCGMKYLDDMWMMNQSSIHLKFGD